MSLRRLGWFIIAATLFAITTQNASAQTDTRKTTVTGYVSSVFNNFISGEQLVYINKNQEKIATSTDQSWAGGFHADIRVSGSDTSKRQLWFFVETLRGVRSVDIDCSNTDATKRPAICSGPEADVTKLGPQAHFILKNASSFEALSGFRLELAKPQDDLAFYVKGQIGLMAVSKAPGDAVDNHFLGIGLTSTTGKLEGSYFDVGWGRTDLYAGKRLDRWKFDGHVQLNIPTLAKARLFPFIQTTADTDFGGGSDSIQTYLGINFDIGDFLK